MVPGSCRESGMAGAGGSGKFLLCVFLSPFFGKEEGKLVSAALAVTQNQEQDGLRSGAAESS